MVALAAVSTLPWLASASLSAQPFSPDNLSIAVAHPRLLFTSAADLVRARSWYSTHT